MTHQDKNEIIAEWLGFIAKDKSIYRLNDEYVYVRCGKLPDYYNTNASFDLLDALMDRGYDPTLEHGREGWDLCIYRPNEASWDLIARCIPPNLSKSVAICEAILQLIEKEKVCK